MQDPFADKDKEWMKTDSSLGKLVLDKFDGDESRFENWKFQLRSILLQKGLIQAITPVKCEISGDLEWPSVKTEDNLAIYCLIANQMKGDEAMGLLVQANCEGDGQK